MNITHILSMALLFYSGGLQTSLYSHRSENAIVVPLHRHENGPKSWGCYKNIHFIRKISQYRCNLNKFVKLVNIISIEPRNCGQLLNTIFIVNVTYLAWGFCLRSAVKQFAYQLFFFTHACKNYPRPRPVGLDRGFVLHFHTPSA